MTKEEQIRYIVENAMTTPLKRIAIAIGRSHCFVQNEMKRQGIVVPQHIRDGFRKSSLFSKGQSPWNKDMPQSEWMSKEAISNSKKTRFKKGNLPHNTKSDFEISLRKDTDKYYYYYIRIKKSKWILYHRWLWTNFYGEIPKGFNLQFKDGDSTNCDISNLYLVDRRNQVVVNKKGGKEIGFELQQTIILLNDLKSKINEKQNH